MAQAKKPTTTRKTTTRTTTAKPKATPAKEVPVQEEAKAVETPAVDNEKAKLEEEIALLKQQIELMKGQQTPQIVTIAQDTEKVHFLWNAPVADENVVTFGEGGMYGRITGKTGQFFVPKSDLSRIMTSSTRYYIDQRWLIVVSGLTDEEREAYGASYSDGELIDKNVFTKLVELGDDIIDIYRDLCESHQSIVAKVYHEEFGLGKHIDRNVVVELNKIKAQPAFKDIIEQMNRNDLN